ncbi:MAG: hypothetical protein GAK38_01578 [Xylophilus sp.]|nr:MAG: hypothetical protein GAK38_01578 [Xylophilus sp.]
MTTDRFLETADYKLFPSPRNVHRVVFEHQVFVPQPYALIDLPSYDLNSRAATVCSPPAGFPMGRWGSS